MRAFIMANNMDQFQIAERKEIIEYSTRIQDSFASFSIQQLAQRLHYLGNNRPCPFRSMIQVPGLKDDTRFATPIRINLVPFVVEARLLVPPALAMEGTCTIAEARALEVTRAAVAAIEVTAVVLNLLEAGLELVE